MKRGLVVNSPVPEWVTQEQREERLKEVTLIGVVDFGLPADKAECVARQYYFNGINDLADAMEVCGVDEAWD